jgi:DNA-binding GntR family transcriptional regulator
MDNIDLSLVPRRVAEVLRADIIFGRMAPESRVIEEDIAERFGVSRSPVRESIRLLERDGLVVRAERRGARVSPLSRRDLDEVYSCRIALEGIAAAEASQRRKPDDVKRLQSILSQLRRAFRKSDIPAYFEANVAFTDTVHDAADNATLKRLLGSISNQALRYRFLAYRSFPHLMSPSLDGNSEVVEAIREQNGEEARARTEQMIKGSWMVIRTCVPE